MRINKAEAKNSDRKAEEAGRKGCGKVKNKPAVAFGPVTVLEGPPSKISML